MRKRLLPLIVLFLVVGAGVWYAYVRPGPDTLVLTGIVTTLDVIVGPPEAAANLESTQPVLNFATALVKGGAAPAQDLDAAPTAHEAAAARVDALQEKAVTDFGFVTQRRP